MVPYLKGFHLTIEMWRGGQDAEGWKQKSTHNEDDNASIDSLMSLTSLDETRAGGHGLDLSVTALYSLNHSEDEDVSKINHRMDLKGGNGHRYAPNDEVTVPVTQFKDDIQALMQLTNFKLPPLQVVRSTQVVQVFYGFRDASGKQFGATLLKNYNCKT
jgi:hypothetical protein